MRILLLGALTAGALIFTATASAVTIQTTDASQPWQQWADQAQVPTYAGALPFTATQGYFACGSFADAEGCTSFTPQVDQTTGQTIPGPPAAISTQIAVVSDQWSDRGTLYHELGQVFWTEYLTPADETAFMRIVGLNGDATAWDNWNQTRVVNGVTLTFSPYEWFAEGYRYCAEYGVNQPLGVNDYEGLGYPGREAAFAVQQREVCQLIDAIGVRNGIATPTQTTYPAPVVKAATAAVKRPRTRIVVIRPQRLRGSGFTWGTKRMRRLAIR